MSETADIQIKGFDRLRAVLSQLEEDMARKVAERALRDGAKVVLEEAQSLVPEGATQRLKESLAIKNVKGELPTMRVYAKRGKGFSGWAANLLEYGTQPHEIRNVYIGKKFYPVVHHPGTSPQPFMRPALSNKKNQALHAIFQNIMKHCTNVLKKGMK